MYGTIARFRALPGRRDELSSLLDDEPVPVVPGWIANYLFALDGDPEDGIFVSVFDNRESYRANSASQEQHQRYLALRALLADEPEWNDGEMFPYMSFREPAADSRPYGSISRLSLKSDRRPALYEHMEAATVRLDEVPGMLAGYLVFADNDPDLAFIVSVFDSPDAYRSNSERPEQHERYLEIRAFLAADPEWYNGYITSFLRF